MKITQVRTIHFKSYPNITFLELETDSGLVGSGETFYTPRTVTAYLREVLVPRLLESDPLQIEMFWRNAYDHSHFYGNRGVEMRALSAVDVALWDIFGQSCGQPVWQLLGGNCHPKGVPVYNTCASDGYAQTTPGLSRVHRSSKPILHDDFASWNDDAGALAKSLIAMGIRCMKIWPFDPLALSNRGQSISLAEVDIGLRPFRQIRDAVGMEMDIILEGHGHWSLAPARRIANALEPLKPLLLEDLMKPDCPRTLAKLRQSTSTPICASELLLNRYAVMELIEAGACDVVMTDPTWAGGFSESRRIANLAESNNMGIIFHDCTGPLTLATGLHLGTHCPNAFMQEIVRSYTEGFYRTLVSHHFSVQDGCLLAPCVPGLGVRLSDSARQHPDCVIQRLDG